MAHDPIIWNEGGELLAKDSIEPWTGGSSIYSSVFVVPKHTGGLWPILNHTQLLYAHTFFWDA